MWDFGPSLCMSQYCSLWVNRVTNFICGGSGSLQKPPVGGFADPALQWDFIPSLGIHWQYIISSWLWLSHNTWHPCLWVHWGWGSWCWMPPWAGTAPGAGWRHFPLLCFSDREIEFNLLANLWWWNSFLVCLFRLLWHPPVQASVAPFGCQGSGWVGTSRSAGC